MDSSVSASVETAVKTIRLIDGRRLGYAEYGDLSGRPALYFHGWPTSRLEAAPAHELALEMGIRLIAIDRPGFGASDLQPNRQLGEWASDVTQFVDALKLDSVAVVGNSGGAPYAAVCAAKIPARITQLVILCGLGPTDTDDASRMMASARWSLRFARLAPRLAAWVGSLALRKLTRPDLRLFSEAGLADLPEADRITLRKEEVREALSAAVREAFRGGARGPVWDGCLFAQPWRFALEKIRVRSWVWHGEKDTIVPVQMGHSYARAIPGCKSAFYPQDGHFSLPFNRMREIFETVCG